MSGARAVLLGSLLLAFGLALPACSLLPSPDAPIIDLAGAISSTRIDIGGLGAEIDASRSLPAQRKANLRLTLAKAVEELDEASDLLSRAGDGPLPEEKIRSLIGAARARARSVRALLTTP